MVQPLATGPSRERRPVALLCTLKVLSAVKVSTCRGKIYPAARGLGEQRLKDAQTPRRKALCAAGHIEPPCAIALLARGRDGRFAVGFQTGHPRTQGARVVLAQALDVAHFEARALGDAERVRHRHELAVGEDEALHKAAGASTSAAVALVGDTVVEEQPAGTQCI